MKKSVNMLKHMTPKPKMTATVRDNAMKAAPKAAKKYDPSHHLGKFLHKSAKKK